MNKSILMACLALLMAGMSVRAQVSVEALKFGTDIKESEIQGEAVSFEASTEKVYCWVRVNGADGKSVTMKWYRDGVFLSDVNLEIVSNSMRTYSYKTLYGHAGTYKVEVLDDAGAVLKTGEFVVTGGNAAMEATTATTVTSSEEDAGIQIEAIKFGVDVEKSEVVGESTTFPAATTDKVYCWMRVLGANGKTVTVKWYFNGGYVGDVPLEIKSDAMRTYAYKSIAGNKGEWRAEVCGPSGAVLQAASFTTN